MASTSIISALTDKRKESLISAVYIGAIFIVIAIIFVVNTGIWDRLVDFFNSLTLAQVPGTSFSLPAPTNPAAHKLLYEAAFQFSVGMGVLEIVILVARILLHSSLARKAETIENLVFWLGASFLIISYLVNVKLPTEWFVFFAGLILIGGLSLLSRAFILLVRRKSM